MLRLTLEIVPNGEEARARQIGQMVISRTTAYANPEIYNVKIDDLQLRVHKHQHSDGAWELVRKAVTKYCKEF